MNFHVFILFQFILILIFAPADNCSIISVAFYHTFYGTMSTLHAFMFLCFLNIFCALYPFYSEKHNFCLNCKSAVISCNFPAFLGHIIIEKRTSMKRDNLLFGKILVRFEYLWKFVE